MGSDGSSLEQGRSHRIMRWSCLAFFLLITVAGGQLLQHESESLASSQGGRHLRETFQQSIAEVNSPVVRRDAGKTRIKKRGKKKPGKKDGRKRQRKENGYKKTGKKDGRKRQRKKNGYKKTGKKDGRKRPK